MISSRTQSITPKSLFYRMIQIVLWSTHGLIPCFCPPIRRGAIPEGITKFDAHISDHNGMVTVSSGLSTAAKNQGLEASIG